MQLERLSLGLRRRTAWEAIDLGLVLLRRWRGPVYRAWFATVLPVVVAASLLLWQWPTVAMLVVWWLKPLYDRVLLKVFAEASFDAPPTVREVWRAMPGLLRQSGLFAALTWRRFNMQRSFDLPVWQLEGQPGKAGRARLRVLGRKTAGHAFWLTYVCLHFVIVFEFGALALLDIASPVGAPEILDWSALFDDEVAPWQTIVFNLAWLAAESIVEPFFVAAGFCLYLNRRSDLEGWDIEVAFRRMAERQSPSLAAASGHAPAAMPGAVPAAMHGAVPAAKHDAVPAALQAAPQAAPRARPGAATGLLIVALAVFVAGAGEARAAVGSCSQPAGIESAAPADESAVTGQRPPGAVRRALDAVLADPVFGREIEDWRWEYRSDEDQKKQEAPWWAKRLAELADLFAVGVRGVIYVIVLVALAALLVVLYRHRHLFGAARSSAYVAPTALFGLDLRPESLPADVAGSALAEIDAGRFAAALSLLYRATLIALVRRRLLDLRAGDTEDSCLRRVAGRLDKDAAAYFALLLDAWKRTAYAGRPPAVAAARVLCQLWPRHFASPGEGGA